MDRSVRQRVAAEVRAEMARQHRAQTELAARLGLTQQGVSRRLLGKVPFSVEELLATADLLGVPSSQFLETAA